MKYVEAILDKASADKLLAIAEKFELSDVRIGLAGDDGLQPIRLLVSDDKLQPVLDTLQGLLGGQPLARVVVLPVEVMLPEPSEEERKDEDAATMAREALYEGVEKNARLDLNFLILVSLSTIVAAIGLIDNNVAVVIGAMVIAPLLGPNLAFGLGTALGDISLMRKSALTNLAGLGLAIALSVIIGRFWGFDAAAPELLSRTEVRLDSLALALASGAAAALSLTTGLSTILVGVMVAVALLPQAVTLGLMLGHGANGLAVGAGLLLVINLVCINLTSKLVFLAKGIHPHNWWEKKKATRAMATYIAIWVATLIILIVIIYIRRTHVA